jgi:hypothetical protein
VIATEKRPPVTVYRKMTVPAMKTPASMGRSPRYDKITAMPTRLPASSEMKDAHVMSETHTSTMGPYERA